MKPIIKPFSSHFVTLRGLQYHVREWGRPGAPRIVMLHGWCDVSATFQFLVDALQGDWHIIAPDWRGFGLSGRGGATGTGVDAYWFPDYLGDLDALLSHYAPPGESVHLLGHSLGGHVACLYAGICPQRVSAVVALDAFGLLEPPASGAVDRYGKWLEQLRKPAGFRNFPDRDAFVRNLVTRNRHLTEARARFLAQYLCEPDSRGGVRLAADDAHRNTYPVQYRLGEVASCWRRIEAPVLWMVQANPEWRRSLGITDEEYELRKACFRNLSISLIGDSGHNMQLEQPEQVAEAAERFLARTGIT